MDNNECTHITSKGLTWMEVITTGRGPFKKQLIKKRCDNCNQMIYFDKMNRIVEYNE